MFTRAIVRPPAANFADGLTTADLGTPDYERALKQHEDYCQALEQCGLTLTRLAPDRLHPDSCFVEDTAILADLPHSRAAQARGPTRCAMLTRPGAPSRAGEVESIRRVLTDFYSEILSLQPPGSMDGGDVCDAGDHFFIGISERTNENGARQLAEMLAQFGYSSSFVEIRGRNGVESVPRAVATGSASESILHLKSGLSYLSDDRLVVIDELANRPEFNKYDLVRVNADEAYAANCIRVNDHILVARGFPVLDRKLRELGYQTIALDMSEFQKMDGGLSCLSLRF
jgi:dimethylargininase